MRQINRTYWKVTETERKKDVRSERVRKRAKKGDNRLEGRYVGRGSAGHHGVQVDVKTTSKYSCPAADLIGKRVRYRYCIH